jgi:hypothetical protein
MYVQKMSRDSTTVGILQLNVPGNSASALTADVWVNGRKLWSQTSGALCDGWLEGMGWLLRWLIDNCDGWLRWMYGWIYAIGDVLW